MLDFTDPRSAGVVNSWVSEATHDKIKKIVEPPLSSMTGLILANAIYFKGNWAVPFSKTATFNQPFHVTSSNHVEVPLMYRLDEIRYMESNDFQAAEVPYNSNRLSMVILLPRRIDACGELEQRLDPALLSRSLRSMAKEKVLLFMPRFKMESSFALNGPLTKMGMSDAFGSKADFSGIDGTRLLYISSIFHKAWVEVNEEGTEAAAATA